MAVRTANLSRTDMEKQIQIRITGIIIAISLVITILGFIFGDFHLTSILKTVIVFNYIGALGILFLFIAIILLVIHIYNITLEGNEYGFFG